ncbi:MAG: hypothetical protein JXA23_10880 [Bacteroidales bacterium]|nr:hypothetical protein [Bacteroidales bacterium]
MKKIFLSQLLAGTVSVVLVLAGLPGCQSAGDKAREESLETVIENSSGEKTEVDINGQNVTIEGDNYKTELNTAGNQWPEGIPEDVPEFTFGEIHGTTATETDEVYGWGIHFADVPKDAVEKYSAALKEKGFKTVKVIMDEGGTVTGEKGKITVSLISGDDMTHLSIQVTK